jgi:4a-hydroxytetrahydrobiopterin dehydratase
MMKEKAEDSLRQLDGWKIVDNTMEKNYKLDDFRKAVEFINKIAEVAEKQNHHSDIFLWNWNNVKLMLTTHSLKGLSKDDFVLAASIDEISKIC